MNILNLSNDIRKALADGLELFKADPSLRRNVKKRRANSEKLSRFDEALSYVNREFETQRKIFDENRIYHRKRFLQQRLPDDLKLKAADINLINQQLANLKRRQTRAQLQFPFNIRKTESALNNAIIKTTTDIPQQDGNYDIKLVGRARWNLRGTIKRIASGLSRIVRKDIFGEYRVEVIIKYLIMNVSESQRQGQTEIRSYRHDTTIAVTRDNLRQNLETIIEDAIIQFRRRAEARTPSTAWSLVGIIAVDVTFRGTNIRGRRFFELPTEYYPARLFKNVKNNDNHCFLWCVYLELLNNQNNDGSDAKIPYDELLVGNEEPLSVPAKGVRADRICLPKGVYYPFFHRFLGYVNKGIKERLKQEGCYEKDDDDYHQLHITNIHHIEDLLNVKIFLWEYKYNFNVMNDDGLYARTIMNTRFPNYNYETDSRKLVIDLLEVTENEWVPERKGETNKHFVVIPRVEALTNLTKGGKTSVRTLCRQCGILLFPQFDEKRRVSMESAEVLRHHLELSKEYHELKERNENLGKDYEEAGIEPHEDLNKDDDDDDLLDPSERVHKSTTSGRKTISSLRRAKQEGTLDENPEDVNNAHQLTETMRKYLRDNHEHIPKDLPEDISEYEIIRLLVRKAPERRTERMGKITKMLHDMEIPMCIDKNKPVFTQYEQKIKFNLGKVGLGKPEVFTNFESRSLYPFTCYIDFESYQQKVYSQDIDSKSLTYEYEQKPYQVGISFSCIRDEPDNPKFARLLENNGIPSFMVLSDNNSKNLVSKLLAYIIHARWVIVNKIYPKYQYDPIPELGKKIAAKRKRVEEYEEKVKRHQEKYNKERKQLEAEEIEKHSKVEGANWQITKEGIEEEYDRTRKHLKFDHKQVSRRDENRLAKYQEELKILEKEYDTALVELAKSNSPDGICFFCCRNVDDVQSEMCNTAEYRVEKKKGDDFDFDPYEFGIGKPSYIIDHFAEEVRLACSKCHYYHEHRGRNLVYDNGLIVYAHNLRGYDGKIILKEMIPKKILEHLLELNNKEKGDIEIPDKCVLGERDGDEKCGQKEGPSRCVHCYPNINSYTEAYNMFSKGGIITDSRSKSPEKIESFDMLFNIHFKDTLEFTLCSLDAFIKNITSGKPIAELRKLFYRMEQYAKSKGINTEKTDETKKSVFEKILMSKGTFPYEFCRVTNNKTTILGKLTKQTEPPIEHYGNGLSEADIEVIREEWRLSKAENLLEYSEFYCMKDVLLLEACFNHFRKQLYNHPYIGLDVARTVTLASLSRNIRLKNNIKHRNVQPLCDDEYMDRILDKTLTAEDLLRYYKSYNSSVNPLDEKLYNMVNRSIKGGVSSVLQTRCFDQDREQNKVCVQIDVNSLYPSTYLQDMPLFPKPIENGIWMITSRYKDDKKKGKKTIAHEDEDEVDTDDDLMQFLDEKSLALLNKLNGEENEEENKEEEIKEEPVKFTIEDINESGLQYDPKKPFPEDCPLSKIEFPEDYSPPSQPKLDYLSCSPIDLSKEEELSKIVRMGELRESLSCTHLFINEWRLYKDSTDYQVYERHLRLREMMFAKPGSYLIEAKLRIPTDIQESIDYMKKFRYPKKYISNAIKVQRIVKKEFNNNLHEFFHTLPPFPAHKTITYDDLSKYNKEIIKHEYLKMKPEKKESEVTEEELRKHKGAASKLVYSFETQDEYVLFNNFLKFLVTEMFVIPEYLYSFVEYETGELMKEFAETLYNARLEYKRNKNNDMQYVMKILLNSAFGRTCMDDSRYGVKREFVDTEEKARARFSRDNYVGCSIIHKDLVLITSKKDTVTVSNGRHIGSFILDSAKVTLMRAVTEMRKKLRKSFETIYTDTDSLFFKIDEKKFDELFSKELIQFMDMGSFKPFIHLFPSKYKDNPDDPIFEVNAGKLGCFSLEDGIPRYKKVIALAAKQYLVEEWKPEPESKRAVKSKSKGVRTGKNANPRLVSEDGEEIDFVEDPDALIDVYQSVLRDKTKSYDARFDSFRSYQMQVYNVSNFKVGIKAYCDKNLIQDDGVTSYFYGQKVTV